MKTFLRFTIATAFLLMTELGCFAQHYHQTNLVSNTSDAAPVTDPQLLIAQFAGGGDTQSSGFIAAYDLGTGNLTDYCRMPAASLSLSMVSGQSAREMSAPRITTRQRRPQQSCTSLRDRTMARKDCSVI